MSTAPQPKLPRGLREQSQNSHRVAARAIWQAQGAESVRKQSKNEHPATVKRRLRKRQNLAGHFVRACAVEMPGHLTRELLCENLQWKSRWPQSIPWSNPGPLATTVRTPQYGHTVWGTIVPFPFSSVNIQLFQDPVRHDATLSKIPASEERAWYDRYSKRLLHQKCRYHTAPRTWTMQTRRPSKEFAFPPPHHRAGMFPTRHPMNLQIHRG